MYLLGEFIVASEQWPSIPSRQERKLEEAVYGHCHSWSPPLVVFLISLITLIQPVLTLLYLPPTPPLDSTGFV